MNPFIFCSSINGTEQHFWEYKISTFTPLCRLWSVLVLECAPKHIQIHSTGNNLPQFSGDYKNSLEAFSPLSEETIISSEIEVTIKHLDPSERERINEGRHERLKADLG